MACTAGTNASVSAVAAQVTQAVVRKSFIFMLFSLVWMLESEGKSTAADYPSAGDCGTTGQYLRTAFLCHKSNYKC